MNFLRKSVAGLVLAALLVMLANSAAALEVGQEAPNFELKNVATGESLKLSDLRGKYVLLDFWATWCGPCRATMEEVLQPLHENLGKMGEKWALVSVGTNWGGETAEKQAAFAKEHKYAWTFVFDSAGTATTAYEVEGIPTIVLVDPQGKIESLEHDAINVLIDKLVPANAGADSAGTFEGDRVEARIDSFAGRKAFRITAAKDGLLVLSTEAEGDFDPILRLLDAEGRTVAENDDASADTTDSRLRYEVKAGETYIAVVLGYGGLSGAFALTKSLDESLATRARAIEAGTTDASVADDTEAIFRFTPGESGTYAIETLGDLDTVMRVLNARGGEIAQSDDQSEENTNARAEVELEAGKEYLIVVTGYDMMGGDFQLKIARAGN